ncbi:MAG TPA: hypothetical protein DCQ31_04225, partial [Bacteroidales bacterium]|nr:hypothetical protein [Bacteroidales bacterium]
MAKLWDKIKIVTENNESVDAQAPVIISASRATDLPAFYSDWFINRLEAGYIKWINPFNNVPLYVSFDKARLFIFWSKNPKPLLKHIDFLNEKKYNYYFQYSLNDYDKTLEKNVPALENRIETFIELSEKIGKEKVIWRFDPLILTNEIGVDELLRKLENIGNQLKEHTNKLVFSFADIKSYKKVQNNLRKASINYVEFNERTMNEIAAGLQALNKTWRFKEIGTCAEPIDLKKYGITHNKCIDDDLMIKLFSKDKKLMDFIGYKPPVVQTNLFAQEPIVEYKSNTLKDKGQREFCGCIMSKDIGQYNTCP